MGVDTSTLVPGLASDIMGVFLSRFVFKYFLLFRFLFLFGSWRSELASPGEFEIGTARVCWSLNDLQESLLISVSSPADDDDSTPVAAAAAAVDPTGNRFRSLSWSGMDGWVGERPSPQESDDDESDSDNMRTPRSRLQL